VNSEADSERDQREQRKQHEEKHPVTFLSGRGQRYNVDATYGDTP